MDAAPAAHVHDGDLVRQLPQRVGRDGARSLLRFFVLLFLQAADFVDAELENFAVVGGEVAVGVGLEGNEFGNDIDLIFERRKANEQWRALRIGIDFIGLFSINNNEAPL